VKIKLDENLSRHLKDSLLQKGHDVTTAFDQGLLGKSDRDVAAAAKQEDRVVLTLDLEFADLRKFPPGSSPGVVVFRPRSMGPLAVNQFILRFLTQTNLEELANCTVVVEPHRVRARRPPGQ
jgi:predicted nuclease of predicted toxin-antitoxin system